MSQRAETIRMKRNVREDIAAQASVACPRVTKVSVQSADPKDPAFKELDRRFAWRQLPIIGRFFGKGYTVVDEE